MSWRYVVYEDYLVVYPDDEYYDHDLEVWDNG